MRSAKIEAESHRLDGPRPSRLQRSRGNAVWFHGILCNAPNAGAARQPQEAVVTYPLDNMWSPLGEKWTQKVLPFCLTAPRSFRQLIENPLSEESIMTDSNMILVPCKAPRMPSELRLVHRPEVWSAQPRPPFPGEQPRYT